MCSPENSFKFMNHIETVLRARSVLRIDTAVGFEKTVTYIDLDDRFLIIH